MPSLDVDIVIVGGGIAGLWTLAESRARGYSCILLESNELGSGQTLASQGIIHGGSKYALGGIKTHATKAISGMPKVWQDANNGNHQVDLLNTRLLSHHQYLVPAKGIDSKLLSFLGSKTMSSHTQSVKSIDLDPAYHLPGISKTVFQLNETVFDTKSIVKTLYDQFKNSIYKHTVLPGDIKHIDEGKLAIQLENTSLLHCRHMLLCCGEGFGLFDYEQPVMQKRPLHMVIAKGRDLPKIYIHFIGRSSKPLLTITSHPLIDGSTAWYLGGGLAEDGVNKNKTEQIQACKQLLEKLLPSIKQQNDLVFDTLEINRAEPSQTGFNRPDDAFIYSANNLHIAWPTKLALAPRLSSLFLEKLNGLIPRGEIPELELPKPAIAKYPWELMAS